MRPTGGQIDDLIAEIRDTVARGERVLVTTLTKKMAEDLADYLAELGIKVQWLHSEVDTLERVEILRDLRLGVYDVLVGINLLREGLDLPEVTLVAILDADKEGFLRSGGSLIQVIGRAARNIGGRVIMYADRTTDSMRAAIGRDGSPAREAGRLQHRARDHPGDDHQGDPRHQRAGCAGSPRSVPRSTVESTEPAELAAMMGRLEAQMKEAARNLEFERAAALRDEILQLRRLREELAAAPGTIPADVYAGAAGRRSSAADGAGGPRPRREVFSVAARPNVIAAGSRRRPPAGDARDARGGCEGRARWPEPCRMPSSSRRGSTTAATVAAYAAELPGCATFAGDRRRRRAAEMPRRVEPIHRVAAEQRRGVARPSSVTTGTRSSAEALAPGRWRAPPSPSTSSPPSGEEWVRWLRWLELAREDLADALDAAPPAIAAPVAAAIAAQDEAFVASLGGRRRRTAAADPLDRCYAARDALTDRARGARCGRRGRAPGLRLAIADDLRAGRPAPGRRSTDRDRLPGAPVRDEANRAALAKRVRHAGRWPLGAPRRARPAPRSAPCRMGCRAAPTGRRPSSPATAASARCSWDRRRDGGRSRPACPSPTTRDAGSSAGSRLAGDRPRRLPRSAGT